MTAKEPIELHCLGSFVITLLYGLERSTADIDVISVIMRAAVTRLEKQKPAKILPRGAKGKSQVLVSE